MFHPDIPPKPQPYRTQLLVAGMFDELGIIS